MHTYVLVEVSAATYNEILLKLLGAGYEHAITDKVIDMHGLALIKQSPDPVQG